MTNVFVTVRQNTHFSILARWGHHSSPDLKRVLELRDEQLLNFDTEVCLYTFNHLIKQNLIMRPISQPLNWSNPIRIPSSAPEAVQHPLGRPRENLHCGEQSRTSASLNLLQQKETIYRKWKRKSGSQSSKAVKFYWMCLDKCKHVYMEPIQYYGSKCLYAPYKILWE